MTGVPGSEQSVEVATVQGINAISLRVDTEVEGTAQTKEVYTGVYTPNRCMTSRAWPAATTCLCP